MSTSPTRHIVVDDTDPGIQYLGPGWSATSGNAVASFGTFGPTFNNTLHQVNNTQGSSLQFQFTGTFVQLFGTLDNAANKSIPNWQCFLDGHPVGQTTFLNETANQITLCQADSLPNTPHQVVVNVTTPGPNFWFDNYLYDPLPGASLADSTLKIDNTDLGIGLVGQGWSRYKDMWFLTSNNRDQLIFEFIGRSMTFVGVAPGELNGTSTTGTYQVDASPASSFIIPGHGFLGEFNQQYFTTPDMPDGNHTLVVTYQGDASHAPMILEFFYVANGTQDGLVPTASSSIAPIATQTGDNHHRGLQGSALTGAVVGIVLGTLALVGCVIAFYFLRRRRRVAGPHHDSLLEPSDAEAAARPFYPGSALGRSENDLRPEPFREMSRVSASLTKGLPPLPTSRPPESHGAGAAAATSSTDVQFVHHADSGVRINGANAVVDIPPSYSEV
ncbi:hypothetical protein EWM64_g6884 [Hericium alpestre]|uniref:Uncharacterized protein n=1 Tax=Hericium alpestre TaxID=135208 RepID=A0A4Y9ZQE7_9AGAM|nr:hypothetical protein EWM64_g6884 [Hericium alpestre]